MKTQRQLFDSSGVSLQLDFNFKELRHSGEVSKLMQRLSVSGVQEKFPAVVKNGKICLIAEGEHSTHILKPAPWDETLSEKKYIPVNEFLTMQIASQVYGIEVAANGLCNTSDGKPVYITRRFDIAPDGSKLPMEDMATLVGRSEAEGGTQFKYHGSYEDVAECIRRYLPAWMVEMERFFELVIFNYIYANGDAHLKNFSVILSGEDYRLAPAYDLLNTALHVHDTEFALDGGLSFCMERSESYLRTGHPCREDFARFGNMIGLRDARVERILDKYMSIPEAVHSLVSQSLLTTKLQRNYLRIILERIHRFVRVSD